MLYRPSLVPLEPAVCYTGASVCVISENFLKLSFPDYCLGNSSFPYIRGVGGARYEVTGSVELDFTIQDCNLTQKFLVVPSLPRSVILGENFLEAYEAIIDYSCNALIIKKCNNEMEYVNFIEHFDQEICGLA